VQMVTELRGLGCTIVYAGLNSVIIATGKNVAEQAEGYMAYTLDSLKSNDVFDFIDFEITSTWESLLFMDKANYGGVTQVPTADQANGLDNGSTPQLQIDSNWNLADFLPEAVQNEFLVLVSEYIYMQLRADDETEGEPVEGQKAKRGLREHYSAKVLDILEGMKLGLGSSKESGSTAERDDMDVEQEEEESVPTAITLVKTQDVDPALQFANFFCHILSLDPAHAQETMLLRRNLLKLLGVREFGEDAKFENPCVSFTLPDVICSFCNFNKDLDLCRDPDLLQRQWNCSSCGQAYNKSHIECTLVEIAQQRATRYQLQDLRCTKCKMIKADNMSAQCSCSGEYTCTESAEELQDSLQTLHRISKYHEFAWLEEVCEWLLKENHMEQAEEMEVA